MKLAIKLHGTSGAGKSTVVRELMRDDPNPTLYGDPKRPDAYCIKWPNFKHPLYVLGPYTNTCGGLDAIGKFDRHIELFNEYAPLGHLIYEGMPQSGFYGRIGEASEVYGENHIFAFMDTPIDTCIDRVAQRRKEKGNLTPLDPKNTVLKDKAMWRLKERLEKGLGIPVRQTVLLKYELAPETLLNLFKEYDAR